jgi:glycopeptide antibiotics resistance protein
MMPTAGTKSNRLGKANLIPFRHHGPWLFRMSPDTSPADVLEMVGNVVLFLPFGTLVSMALDRGKRCKWSHVLLAFVTGLLFSTFIETTQFWLPTRYTDIDDVILNSSGALLGALLVPAIQTVREFLSGHRKSLGTSLRARRLADVPVPLRRR